MNFDLEMLKKLLDSISKRCPRFDDRKEAHTLSLVAEMQPDVRFWGTTDFIAWLESEYEAMCDELGI